MTSPPYFSDIQTHWARPFIEALAQRGIVRGFGDGTFRPDRNLTRSEFAALTQVLSRPPRRPPISFLDVPTSHWAATAIRRAYETGFLAGYPDRRFRPDDPLPRVQALVALANGLELKAPPDVPLGEIYRDSQDIPNYGISAIAAATIAEIVVNFPQLNRLRPLHTATRGDVAAWIYQCLVYLQQAPEMTSNHLVRWVRTVKVSHRREFRAVWLTSVWNIDFPSQTGLSAEQQQAELVGLLDRMQSLNLNALIFQVRPEGDALYASELEPWSHWLSGTQGKPPEPFYDPLAFAIDQCHQRNIELHAWFNPYRARTSRTTVNVAPHIATMHPEVVYPWGNQLWMDPGAAVVQERTYSVIMDVVRRYDVDGIHLDDYFYPYPIAGQTFPDDPTYQAYRTSGGTLELGDWRRENVNQLVQRLGRGIRALKPQVKFGISPFGIYRPGQPPQIRGLDAYDAIYADSLKWLQEGWVDYLSPQLYWRIDPPAQSYSVLLQWWADSNLRQRHLYPGNNLGQLDGRSWEVSEIERQVDLTRQLESRLVLGNIFFSMGSIATNRLGISDRFQSATYPVPALAPSLPWLQNLSPALPKRVQVRDGKVTWNPAPVRSWTVYRQEGSTWALLRILPAATTALPLPAGTYALCAVDRLANESAGVIVLVS